MSLRADRTPPRKVRRKVGMVDVKGFPLASEPGPELVTEKQVYSRSEYSADNSPSVVLNSDSYKNESLSTANSFSKGNPAALPIVEIFPEQSEVSKSLLGIDRQTEQKGLFSNVSVYGLDAKDWEFEFTGYRDGRNRWWTRRPSASGPYTPAILKEDDKNSALRLTSNPTPYLEPPVPLSGTTFREGSQNYSNWGQYLNSVVALYLFKYMVKNFSEQQKLQYNLKYILDNYPIVDNDGEFNEIYWDKIWLDIRQNRLGAAENYPLVPGFRAYNFKNVQINNFRSDELWGEPGVVITEANSVLPASANFSWNSDYFAAARAFFPLDRPDNYGHFYIKTNPDQQVWEKYFGLRWNLIKPEIKNWEFTIHETLNTVTQIEKDLKLPYLVLEGDRQVFSISWPSALLTDLPVNGNRIGGRQGIDTGIVLKSTRAFRYQPGRISGFTYGVKLSEIGAGPGTTVEFGIENLTDSYMFRLTDGANFSIIRKSIVPLENTIFLQDSGYQQNTKTIVIDGQVFYETIIGQNIMNGDPLSGEGPSGYILDPDTVTMYKIEFGWYGAIGARFYAYVPVGNDECRWVTIHTLVIENQLRQPCLGDPFFFFTYRLNIEDSSSIRVDQFVDKFGASYYIDGYDDGNVTPLSAGSGVRQLPESSQPVTPLDWITIFGIKPRQFLTSSAGVSIYNKKEVFPEKLNVVSTTDCEIKVIRQRGCPEFAYNHQEGYRWTTLSETRRPKAKFFITPNFKLNLPSLEISQANQSTHTAIATYSTSSTGSFRDPRVESNWDVIGNQYVRLLANDLFGVFTDKQSFEPGSLLMRLKRPDSYRYTSSRVTIPEPIKTVSLPFTYATIPPNTDGYDVEIDYFRRDQILLSTVDVNSGEFYIYFVGGRTPGPNPGNYASVRFGFAWPDVTNEESGLYATSSSLGWGIEQNAEYDGETFYEGLPYDFVEDYPTNCLYIETGSEIWYNTYGLEIQEEDFFTRRFLNIDPDYRLSAPGIEGGVCRGLFCKYGRELRENTVIISEFDEVEMVEKYYISDPEMPWPNLQPKNYVVTLFQGNNRANVETTGGFSKTIEEVTVYLIPIGESLPEGIEIGPVSVSYNIIYMATMDQSSRPVNILTSEIAPGDIPFIRVFLQGRQGAQLGGVWIGQKTDKGVQVDPFTPHRCTLSISDTGTDYHSQWSSDPQEDGAVKVITAYTQDGTAPTLDASENNLNTFKSIHTSPKKCGSFISPDSRSSSGVFIGSQYPLRTFTQPRAGTNLSTYYISANTPTQIELKSVFNVFGEAVLNSFYSDFATFFVARSLQDPGEITISTNYVEQ
jgi:hypothetical protein